MKAPRLVAILSLTATLASCTGDARPRPRAPAPSARVDLKRAKAPAQAVILGTGGAGDATTLPLPSGPRTVTVTPLFVRGDGADATGGVGWVALTVRPATDGQVKVGVFEDVSGGAGPEWRAGVWLAAYVAVTALDKDLTDFSIEASSTGHVDGASASALMAAALVAAIVGWPLAPDATLTGTINPDGTVGPVAGIPQKFTAALAAGKRRLGYPVGQRFAVDAATGAEVDLVELARAHGGEAVEVSDLYGAIELMTGRTLPRPTPAPIAAMALPPAIDDRLAARVDAWDHEVDALLEDLDAVAYDDVSLAVLSARARAHVAHDDAYAWRKQGLTAAAYHAMVEAWIAATAATTSTDLLTRTAAGDVPGAIATLDDHVAALDDTQAVVEAIGARAPATMGDHLQMLAAFDAASDAWSVRGVARAMTDATRARLRGFAAVHRDPVAVDRVGRDVVTTMTALARAQAATREAEDALAIETTASARYQCSLPNVKRLATSFTAAAGSGVAYVEALGGVTTDLDRDLTAIAEPDYVVAAVASRVADADGLPAALRAAWGEDSIGWRLFTLAATQQAYFRTARLASRWHSLRVRTDLNGRPYAIGNERALINMLEFAETRARERAHAAALATGTVPVQAQLQYQLGRGLRDGDLAAKLDALAAYWAASAYAEAALMLARN